MVVDQVIRLGEEVFLHAAADQVGKAVIPAVKGTVGVRLVGIIHDAPGVGIEGGLVGHRDGDDGPLELAKVQGLKQGPDDQHGKPLLPVEHGGDQQGRAGFPAGEHMGGHVHIHPQVLGDRHGDDLVVHGLKGMPAKLV